MLEILKYVTSDFWIFLGSVISIAIGVSVIGWTINTVLLEIRRKRCDNFLINNDDFLKAIIKYRTEYFLAKDAFLPKPKISKYIRMCFFKIAENLSKKSNFSGYSFKDKLVLDAIENCIQVCHNFDPSNSSNLFAYFTQITYNAFVKRIDKEKNKMIKRKMGYL